MGDAAGGTKTVHEQPIARAVGDFHAYLKGRDRGSDKSSFDVARRTVEAMRDVLSQVRWTNARELMETIQHAGKILHTGLPSEPIVDNMVRRVLLLVREAYSECLAEQQSQQNAEGEHEVSVPTGLNTSLQALLLSTAESVDFDIPFKTLKQNIIQQINEFIVELEDSTHNIASQALEHIHSNEVIMTYGHSRAVEAFLKKAAQKRTFSVIVAESAPSYNGHQMAMSLSKEGIETTLITDSAVFAVMSRVNKVIIGTHLVMADGGLMAVSGCHAVALAAKHHSVPVIVCAAMYKLCPTYPCSYEQDMLNHLHSPATILPYSDAQVVGKSSVVHPLFDYVPPNVVNLFVSNIGSNAPSYIYRLLSEYYHADDSN